MAKAPAVGAVKSRLARGVGWVRATAFHRQGVHALALRLGRTSAWDTYIAVTPDGCLRSAFPTLTGASRLAQGAGDLGARMHRVMATLPPGPVIIIGTDIPEIRPRGLARAFRLLGSHAAVIGPGLDGGYWLVGLRRSPRVPAIFRDVRWSSPHTLNDTLANMAEGCVAIAETLEDVDDGASYRRLAGAASRVVLPARRAG